MEQFSALRIMAEDEALDVRNRDSVLMLDRCRACGREFITRVIIPHQDNCSDIPKPKAQTWWKRLLS
jgi:hypothetical protein